MSPKVQQSGRERLRDWIERGNFGSDRAAAEVLGVHPVVLSLWLSGTRNPDLDNAVHIEQVTGISVESWLLTQVSQTDAEPVATGKKRPITKR